MKPVWIKVQKKILLCWVNLHLAKRNMKIKDVASGLLEGGVLVNLVEEITGHSFKSKSKTQFNPNPFDSILQVNSAMKFLASVEESVVKQDTPLPKLVNIGFLRFVLSRYLVRKEEKLNRGFSKQPPDALKEDAVKDMLLSLLRELYQNLNVELRNFTSSFTDGRAFAALIYCFRPELLNFRALGNDPRQTVSLAFDIGSKYFGVPTLFDPANYLIFGKPDEVSVMAYILCITEAAALLCGMNIANPASVVAKLQRYEESLPPEALRPKPRSTPKKTSNNHDASSRSTPPGSSQSSKRAAGGTPVVIPGITRSTMSPSASPPRMVGNHLDIVGELEKLRRDNQVMMRCQKETSAKLDRSMQMNELYRSQVRNLERRLEEPGTPLADGSKPASPSTRQSSHSPSPGPAGTNHATKKKKTKKKTKKKITKEQKKKQVLKSNGSVEYITCSSDDGDGTEGRKTAWVDNADESDAAWSQEYEQKLLAIFQSVSKNSDGYASVNDLLMILEGNSTMTNYYDGWASVRVAFLAVIPKDASKVSWKEFLSSFRDLECVRSVHHVHKVMGSFGSVEGSASPAPALANELSKPFGVGQGAKLALSPTKLLPPSGHVTIVVVAVEGLADLWEQAEAETLQTALSILSNIVREHAGSWRGYVSQCDGSGAKITFSSVLDAVNWSLGFQSSLLSAQWPPAILSFSQAKEEKQDNSCVQKGLRAKVGIHSGRCIVHIDPISTLPSYMGRVYQTASAISDLAKGGQTLLSGACWNEVVEHGERKLKPHHVAEAGSAHVNGSEENEIVELVQLLPRSLSGRRFPLVFCGTPSAGVENESLKDENESLRAAVDSFKSELDHAREESAGYSKQLEDALYKIESLSLDIADKEELETALGDAHDRIISLQVQFDAITEDQSSKKGSPKSRKEIESLESEKFHLQDENVALRERLEIAEEELVALQNNQLSEEQRFAMQGVLSQSEAKVKSLEARIKVWEVKCTETTQQLERALEQNSLLQQRLSTAEDAVAKNTNLQQELAKLRKVNASSESDRDAIKEECKDLKAKADAALGEVERLRVELKDAVSTKNKATKLANKLQELLELEN